MNLPNSLTIGRILLLPPLLIALLYASHGWALALFLLAAFSDALDGWLARRLDQVTLLGSYLDPLGDKLLTAVTFIALAARGDLPAWLAVLVVARDLLLMIGAAILFLSGQRGMAIPSWFGKGSTFLQLATIALVLLTPWCPACAPLLVPAFWTVGIVTVLSGAQYVWFGCRTLDRAPEAIPPLPESRD